MVNVMINIFKMSHIPGDIVCEKGSISSCFFAISKGSGLRYERSNGPTYWGSSGKLISIGVIWTLGTNL